MFVIQKLLDEHREKVKVWEKDCSKWMSEDTPYGYRSRSDYADRYLRPGSTTKFILKIVFILLIIAIVITFLLGVTIKADDGQKDETKKIETSEFGEGCRDFKLNDYARIQYGDYAGIKGRIIGGCERSQAYQVKLDNDQHANISYDGIAESIDVGSHIISVDSSDNLAIIQDKKEYKKK